MGRHYSDDEVLEFLLDGVVDGCDGLTPSHGLKTLWEDDWEVTVRETLEAFWANYTASWIVPLDDVYNTSKINVPFDVYATCVGMGVGMRDGDWDQFFAGRVGLDQCVKYVEKALTKFAHDLEQEIYQEAEAQCESEDEEEEGADKYEVLVGNIGNVYRGTDYIEANNTFNEYVRQSQSGSGRAAGEEVTIFKNDEVWKEHIPQGRRKGMKINPTLDGFQRILAPRQLDGWTPVGAGSSHKYAHPCSAIAAQYASASKRIDRIRYALSRSRKDARWFAREAEVLQLEADLRPLKEAYDRCVSENPVRPFRKFGKGL